MYKPAASTGLTLTILGLMPFAPATASEKQMSPIIVTASRTAETADETLASVTVIDRQTIERSQATDISELLRGVAGVNLSSNGGDGKNKNLFLRGTNSSHTLLLIDGFRAGSATLGVPSWSFIPLNDIERIEIVRGPRSSLYGSDAIGGVIQVFTRKGEKGFKTSAAVGYGTDNHYKLEGTLSYGSDNSRFRLALGHEETDGYDVRAPIEADDDGFENLSVNANFSHQITDRVEITGSLLRSAGETEFDGSSYSGNITDFIQQSGGLAINFDVTDTWQSTLRAGHSRDLSNNYYNDTFVNKFDTQRKQFAWENSIDLNDWSQLVAGLDYYEDEIDATTEYAETSRDNKAAFGQYRLFGETHDLQLGVRHDDNEQFGGHTTGNIAWGMKMADNLRFTVSAGTAFKAPTFNDLYWPASPWSSGNTDLVPEKARSYELGLNGKHAGVSWSARAYRNDIDNLINWACTDLCTDDDPYNDFWQPTNVDQAEITGLELEASTKLLGWNSQLTINLLNPKDKLTGNVLAKRAKRSAKLSLDRDFGKWSLGGTLLAESSRWNDPYNSVKLAGYATVDLHAGYQLNNDWQIRASVTNLFDREYQTSDGFAMAERELFISLAYQPK